MPVTIKDIARQLGISYATVSRALNNKYGVDPQTRQQVLETAQSLHYRRNDLARGLVKQRTATIGLIVPDITNPFYPEVARGVEEAAHEAGYSVFLCNTAWEQERELLYVRLLAEKRVEGLIIAPTAQTAETIETLLTGQIPVIYVSDTQNNLHSSFIAIDNVRGGYLATEHLIQKGYYPIAYLGALEDSLTNEERCTGYIQALKQYNFSEEPLLYIGSYHSQTAYQIMCERIAESNVPRAVFAVNDLFALGAMQAVREHGLRIPQDVAIVGFDDIPLASFPEIQLTTVAQPKREMGQLAFAMLQQRMTSPTSPPQRTLLEPHLVIRKSS
ncbi:MAG: LacI family DNA-binding transcriptional regulator [Anaerolineae bacterium]|nr:LacI family DNA-binding transcriptional regulator [Anaerolineae bacterium]